MKRGASKRLRRTAMGGAACLALLANRTTAEAFTYPEHVVITNAALAHANRVDGPATKLALSALQAFVQPEGKRSWPLDVELGRGLPPATFHAADLVALAADHSTTPINLLVRWFWWYDAGSRCSCSNAIDAILSLDNSAEPPTVCMGGTASGRFAVDRAGFLETVRAYHDARGVLKSTSGIDLKLANHDCAYTCMAERGRTHFRIPTLTIEDASYRHDYPNAASSYAMNHAIAIGLAMMSADPEPEADAYLGLAMVYEAFALHYLQDGIAPGHIVSSHHGYGNITVNGTHDHYNREGIVVSLSEGLCQQAAQMPLPHAFSNLRSQCLTPPEQRSPRLYGDHAMANKLGGGKGDVTADVAELLTLASLLRAIAPKSLTRAHRERGAETLGPSPREVGGS